MYVWVYERFCLYELPWDSTWTWILAFFLQDFAYYWVHRCGHGTYFLQDFFFFFLLWIFITQHFLFYWMVMMMGMIVDDAEEFPCGDGLRDRAVIHASYHNYL